MRVKLQFYSTIVCLLGIALGFACKLWFPEYWTDWYLVVLIVYWTIEMAMGFVLERYEGKMSHTSLEGKRFMKVYMISKFVKVLVTLALIAVGIVFIGNTETKEVAVFAGSAVVLYLLNLSIETHLVTKQMNKEKSVR